MRPENHLFQWDKKIQPAELALSAKLDNFTKQTPAYQVHIFALHHNPPLSRNAAI